MDEKRKEEHKKAIEEYKRISKEDERFNYAKTMLMLLLYCLLVFSIAIGAGVYISLHTFSGL
jgi:uncharacterized membrane protein (DUF485 family)